MLQQAGGARGADHQADRRTPGPLARHDPKLLLRPRRDQGPRSQGTLPRRMRALRHAHKRRRRPRPSQAPLPRMLPTEVPVTQVTCAPRRRSCDMQSGSRRTWLQIGHTSGWLRNSLALQRAEAYLSRRRAHPGLVLLDICGESRKAGVERRQQSHKGGPACVAMSVLELAQVARVGVGTLRKLLLGKPGAMAPVAQRVAKRLLRVDASGVATLRIVKIAATCDRINLQECWCPRAERGRESRSCRPKRPLGQGRLQCLRALGWRHGLGRNVLIFVPNPRVSAGNHRYLAAAASTATHSEAGVMLSDSQATIWLSCGEIGYGTGLGATEKEIPA